MIVFLLLSVFLTTGQDDKFYYENAVYNENIKTVLMYRDGFSLSNPVLGLNEEQQLVFKFDDLSGRIMDCLASDHCIQRMTITMNHN